MLCGVVRCDYCGHPVPPGLGRASVAVLFQQPVLIVAIEVGPDGGAHLFDVLVDASEHDLLLQRTARPSAFQCSATMNSVTLPSLTVGTTAPSAPHMTFGASVVIEPSWSFAGRGGRRCGESRLFSPMIRSTRLRPTRMPSITCSRAQTLRCPSPAHGERARSWRMAASRSSSLCRGFGPRRPAGLPGGRASWCRES